MRKARRSLTWMLVILLALTGVLTGGVLFSDAKWAPELALDLQGGTQIILEAQPETGQTVSQEQLDQSVAIIRQRVDASGVAEAEVATQGQSNLVVSIPGEPDEGTLERLQASARLEFRPVLIADIALPVEAAPEDEEDAEPEPRSPLLQPTPAVDASDASDLAWITEPVYDAFLNIDCASTEDSGANVAPAALPLVTCQNTGEIRYILGPAEVSGERIDAARADLVTTSTGASTGQWGVFIEFDSLGTQQFRDVTTRLAGLPGQQNQFAIVLDGQVISAPTTVIITDGRPMITGDFTQETATVLADQLRFGALPIGFEIQSIDTISATLGTNQLAAGLTAGIIGLALVVIYSLFQYRLLGLVTVASLIVAGVLAYLAISILSWRQGYRLSLAGVAGLIVAIGFTVDSFIVYFERIRDELRDGRALVGAVEAGWKRALRTILASKGINLLSSVVLFVLAIGNVRGFAFTLGLTVIIDVLVVLLFTHPMLQLLAGTKFFQSGHPASGLDPKALGAVYRGRAQFRAPAARSKASGANREAVRRQTIAERKAAELAGAGSAPSSAPGSSSKES